MKKTAVFISFILFFVSSSYGAGKTIAVFQKKQYMLGPDMQFSIDGKTFSFTARDGNKYFGPHYLYTGSSSGGPFRKVFSDPVSSYIWKSSTEIIYSSLIDNRVIVKSGNTATSKSSVLFEKKLNTTGSGYARKVETYRVCAISPTGEFMLVEKDKNICVLVNLKSGNEVAIPGFIIPYSGNPVSTLKFSGNGNRLLLFDGKESSYSVYNVANNGLSLLKKISKIKGISPGSNYVLSDSGVSIAFTEEKCKGGCFHIVYVYDLEKDKLYENITIKSGQILNVAIDRDFTKAAINNMHRKLTVFTLKKNGKEIK